MLVSVDCDSKSPHALPGPVGRRPVRDGAGVGRPVRPRRVQQRRPAAQEALPRRQGQKGGLRAARAGLLAIHFLLRVSTHKWKALLCLRIEFVLTAFRDALTVHNVGILSAGRRRFLAYALPTEEEEDWKDCSQILPHHGIYWEDIFPRQQHGMVLIPAFGDGRRAVIDSASASAILGSELIQCWASHATSESEDRQTHEGIGSGRTTFVLLLPARARFLPLEHFPCSLAGRPEEARKRI